MVCFPVPSQKLRPLLITSCSPYKYYHCFLGTRARATDRKGATQGLEYVSACLPLSDATIRKPCFPGLSHKVSTVTITAALCP